MTNSSSSRSNASNARKPDNGQASTTRSPQPHSRTSTDSIPWRQAIVALAWTVIFVVILAGMVLGRAVLIPLSLAILLSFVLTPIISWLRGRGIPKTASVLFASGTLSVALLVVGYLGSQQIGALVEELPAHTQKIRDKVKTVKSWFGNGGTHKFENMIVEIQQEIADPAAESTPRSESSPPGSLPQNQSDRETAPTVNQQKSVQSVSEVPSQNRWWAWGTDFLGSAMEGMGTLGFTVVLLLFFLLEKDGLRDRVVLLSGRSRLTVTSNALDEAADRVGKYLGMVSLINAGFGLVLGVGLYLLGTPYALLWGVLAALLRFIPYLGPMLSAGLPISVTIAMSNGWSQPIAVTAFLIILELITNNLVEPMLFSKTTGVSPTVLLIAAGLGAYVWGPVGLVISTPLAVCLAVLGKYVPQLQFLDTLLSDSPALNHRVGFYQRLISRNYHDATDLVIEQLKEPGAKHVFDDLLIPALCYFKRDLKANHLSDDDEEALQTAIRESLATVNIHRKRTANAPDQDPESASEQLPSTESPRTRLLGCAADGTPDYIALLMLQELLDPADWDVVITPPEMLTYEIVEMVEVESPDIICIGSLPPGGVASARYLARKLRAVTTCPLVVGLWGQKQISSIDRDRLMSCGATDITHSLLLTSEWLTSRRNVLMAVSA